MNRALVRMPCHLCTDLILPGDRTALHDDKTIHAECSPSPEPWTKAPPAIEELTALLTSVMVGNHLAMADWGREKYEALPAAIKWALDDLLVAENELYELLRAHQGEHSRTA